MYLTFKSLVIRTTSIIIIILTNVFVCNDIRTNIIYCVTVYSRRGINQSVFLFVNNAFSEKSKIVLKNKIEECGLFNSNIMLL